MRLVALLLCLQTIFAPFFDGVSATLYPVKETTTSCCADNCSKENTETKHSDKEAEDDDCCDYCSPFQHCCCAHFFYHSDKIDFGKIALLFYDSSYLLPNNDVQTSLFTTEFWQPPRFV